MKKYSLNTFWSQKSTLLLLISVLLVSSPASDLLAKTYAFIAADARDGKILSSYNANKLIHPASLTKMMTLYIAFDAIRYGRLKLDEKVSISKNAASEPPSKFWYKPGQKVSIRYLIRASAIRSANDAATALGEAISGSEKKFIKEMNIAAKKMGLKSTRFKNAHGLTEIGHYSTAKDMLLLARRLMLDYPEYFNIFSRIETFASGKTIRNTNYKFLKQYRGASGIKTGYTNAAGHNLAAAAKRGDKRVIGILIGTNSSSERTKKMAKLLDKAFSAIPQKKSMSKLKPLNLTKKKPIQEIVKLTVPLAKPRYFESMLRSLQNNDNARVSIKKQNKDETADLNKGVVNVQIGMYKNKVIAEKDMPNILLLNIDLLTNMETQSIKIRENKEKGFSIFFDKVTYTLAENLCLRTRSQETVCSIFKN